MTKLYLFEESGALAFCENVLLPDQGLQRVEEFGAAVTPGIKGWLVEALSNTSAKKEPITNWKTDAKK